MIEADTEVRMHMSMQRWLGLLWAGLIPFCTLAQTPSETPTTPSSNSVPALKDFARILTLIPVSLRSVFSGEHTWEEWHDYWSESLSQRVDYIDHFFGEQILKEDNRDTRLMLRLGLRFDRYDYVSVESEINARLSLPQLQRRLQLIFDSGSNLEEAKALRIYEDATKQSAPDTGIRYVMKEERRIRLHLDTGLHLSRTSQFFGRIRTRYTLPLGLWQLRLQERVEWRNRDGFGQTSEMIWDRKMSDEAILRLRSAVDWAEKDRGVTPKQSLVYYRIINARASYKAGILAAWPETPHGGNDVYEIVGGYRRVIYGDWLFLEIGPGLSFEDEHEYAPNPFIAVIVEVTFQRDKPLGLENPTGFYQR